MTLTAADVERMSPRHRGQGPGNRRQLREMVEHLAHFLPAQGPITVFVHHNTLHALQHLPFDDAVALGAKVYGCQPYLTEERYQQQLAAGRIHREDLAAELLDDLGDGAEVLIGTLGTRFHLRLAMLEHPLQLAPAAELRWFVAENDALRRFRGDVSPVHRDRMIRSTRQWMMRDLRVAGSGTPTADERDVLRSLEGVFQHFPPETIERWTNQDWESFTLRVLWQACREGVRGAPGPTGPHRVPLRHRDVLLEATGEDSDQRVNEVLIRFCAAFLDQGLAHWAPSLRGRGFFDAFRVVYGSPGLPPERWMRGLAEELARIEANQQDPYDCVLESLDVLGVSPEQREPYLLANLLALRGWAGMIWQMETRADRVGHPVAPGTLVEYLAVRLLLKRFALRAIAEQHLGYRGSLSELKTFARSHTPRHASGVLELRTFLAFQLAQALGWNPRDLFQAPRAQWAALVAEFDSFSALERRKIYQRAFERRYRIATLDALAARARRRVTKPERPWLQVVTCIDDREESLRRHLEEIDPRVETIGAAGFFAVAMYYRGAADAHYVPLCPVVVRPQHYVCEQVDQSLAESDLRRGRLRRWVGRAVHQFHVGSRTFTVGALLALILGPLASIPLLVRVLFPRLADWFRRYTGAWVQPPRLTQLDLARQQDPPSAEAGHHGFTPAEMADLVERMLRDSGMTSGFARLVLILGHGSSSLNNPHSSAYECGACGGGRGGPNARAFANLANRSDVRQLLRGRGLDLPPETVFLGAWHNTCDDRVTYFDLSSLPASHLSDLARTRTLFDQALERNAHERCRRFVSAPLSLTPTEALRHVEERSADLSQTRPECGHATNAVCIVGRRERTLGLFMDRRAFLTSYDYSQDDDENTVLTRVLSAVVPVCGGINLEYYFSYVDSAGWGCGTKLPHNITSLLGVMDGTASDLRPGLPWQMVEIHEPVRLLMVIEAPAEAVLQILERNPAIDEFFRNAWIQLALLDPKGAAIQVYRRGEFVAYRPHSHEIPQVASSQDWYSGWREHLEFALIVPPGPASTAPGPGEVRHA